MNATQECSAPVGVAVPANRADPLWFRSLEFFLIAYACFPAIAIFNPLLSNGQIRWSSLIDGWPWSFWLKLGTCLFLLIYILYRHSKVFVGYASESWPWLLDAILVITVAYGASIYRSLWQVATDHPYVEVPAFFATPHTLSWVIHYAVDLGVVAYVLYSRAASFRTLGFEWSWRQLSEALPLVACGVVMQSVAHPLADWVHQLFSWHESPYLNLSRILTGLTISPLEIPNQLGNGFSEELIVRGFLMTAILRLTGRGWLAVIVSVAVQVSYHFYQGVPAALSHVGEFTFFSLYYLKTRRLMPLVIAHSLFDLHIVMEYGLQLAGEP